MKIVVRRAAERGRADLRWLDRRHSFSFGDYHDPRHMGHRTLCVINEDRIAPASGFPTHDHRDMEIFSGARRGARAQGQHGQRPPAPAGADAGDERRQAA